MPRGRIRIIDHDVCLHCVRQQCINCCPANCYVPADDGRVIFSYEGLRRVRHLPHRLPRVPQHRVDLPTGRVWYSVPVGLRRQDGRPLTASEIGRR